jgi:hypothetical protein
MVGKSREQARQLVGRLDEAFEERMGGEPGCESAARSTANQPFPCRRVIASNSGMRLRIRRSGAWS